MRQSFGSEKNETGPAESLQGKQNEILFADGFSSNICSTVV